MNYTSIDRDKIRFEFRIIHGHFRFLMTTPVFQYDDCQFALLSEQQEINVFQHMFEAK